MALSPSEVDKQARAERSGDVERIEAIIDEKLLREWTGDYDEEVDFEVMEGELDNIPVIVRAMVEKIYTDNGWCDVELYGDNPVRISMTPDDEE